MQAMILAAGFGTRLLPYTQYRPKPLFPVLNTPLLLLTINRLKADGFDHIVVNCHHLKEQIIEVLSGINGVIVQDEGVILGTGGGLRKALDTLHDEPLLVINGDIYHTVDCRKLYVQHQQSGAEVTLAVHDYPRFNTLLIEDGRLLGFAENDRQGNMAFTGIHVLNPEVLEPINVNKKSCIIARYSAMLQQKPEAFSTSAVDDCFWTDMGTPADYLKLHGDILQQKVPSLSELGNAAESSFCVDYHCSYSGDLTMEDWACVGRCTIGKNVNIVRSIIWEDAVIPDNSRIVDTIFVNK